METFMPRRPSPSRVASRYMDARKFGYDAVVDNGGNYAVVFDPSVVRVVKVEPMTRDS